MKAQMTNVTRGLRVSSTQVSNNIGASCEVLYDVSPWFAPFVTASGERFIFADERVFMVTTPS